MVHPRPFHPSGLTLIEILCAVASVALLLSIVLVGLQTARSSAIDGITLGRLRDSSHDFAAWANDHDDGWVNGRLGYPNSGHVWLNGANGATINFDYLYGHIQGWTKVLEAHFGERSEAWISPRSRVRSTPFSYSMSMITDPALWEGCFQEKHPITRYFRLVRMSEVAYPSTKGVIGDLPNVHPIVGDPPKDAYLLAMSDGSASRFSWTELVPGSLTACVPSPNLHDAPLLRTPRGVLGTDIR